MPFMMTYSPDFGGPAIFSNKLKAKSKKYCLKTHGINWKQAFNIYSTSNSMESPSIETSGSLGTWGSYKR